MVNEILVYNYGLLIGSFEMLSFLPCDTAEVPIKWPLALHRGEKAHKIDQCTCLVIGGGGGCVQPGCIGGVQSNDITLQVDSHRAKLGIPCPPPLVCVATTHGDVAWARCQICALKLSRLLRLRSGLGFSSTSKVRLQMCH